MGAGVACATPPAKPAETGPATGRPAEPSRRKTIESTAKPGGLPWSASVATARRHRPDDDQPAERDIEAVTSRILEGALLARTAVP